MHITSTLRDRLALAIREAYEHDVDPEVVETISEEFGDYQTNVAMQIRDTVGAAPRDIAKRILEHLESDSLIASAEVAGPGFINFRLSDDWIRSAMGSLALDTRLGVDRVTAPRTVAVDFSSPNVAKRMHVGHLRSTIIGDAIVRILRFNGHRVIGDNHVGDWGAHFGLLLWGWKEIGDEQAFAEDPIGELERIYREVITLREGDPEVADACRAELVALQGGDLESLALWRRFVAVSRSQAEEVYGKLGVSFELWRGESAYNAMLSSLVEELLERELATESRGAIIVPFPEGSKLEEHPFMIRKSDGTFLYSTTDIATVKYRVERLGADWLIYVVDKRQSLHFEQLFTTAQEMGYGVRLDHVGFGMMLGDDGRPFRTREGGVVRLDDLISEAEERLRPTVRAKWPQASEDEVRHIANRVGTGAIKYADLSLNLASDYKFDWDRMLAPEGNTGPYLQYTLVRLRSVFRVYRERFGHGYTPEGVEVHMDEPLELQLAKKLVRFGDVLDRCERNLTPHVLCDYLYDVAKSFNTFYGEHQILPSGVLDRNETTDSRLLLCYVIRKILEQGLDCLNIPTVERM